MEFHQQRAAIARRATLVSIAGGLLAFGWGCGEPTAPPAPVATVGIAPSTAIRVVPGGSESLSAVPKDAAGNTLTNRTATWASSDPSKVTVAGGLLTGVAKGSATVTVTVEGRTATAEVEVRDGAVVTPSGASFSAFDGAIAVAVPPGAFTQTRNVTLAPASAPPPNSRLVAGTAFEIGPAGMTAAAPVGITIAYDPAKVDSDSPQSGLQLYEVVGGNWSLVANSTVDVTARKVSGNVTQFGTYAILMQPRVDTVTVNGPPASLASQATFQFTATLKDNTGLVLNRTATWTSSNPAVLRIDATTGLATALVPGTVTVTATSEKKTGTATVTVVPGPPARLARVAGDGQTAAAGIAVPIPPSVKVTDQFGNAIPGFAIVFAVTGGGGQITGGSAATNAEGVATVGSWVLGTVAGQNTITASGAGLPESPLTFTASGVAGGAAIIAAASATALTGTAGGLVGTLPSVKVTDANGNAVGGVTVTFSPSGGGSVEGGSATTNSSGLATVASWRLGTTAGSQTLLATAPGLTGSPITFTVAAAAPVPSTIAANAGNGQTAVILGAVAIPPSVRITDPAGIPVPGVQVTFAVTGGGGSISGASPVTDANGVAAVGGWVLGPTVGQNTLTATSGTLSGSPVTFTATAFAPVPVAITIVAGDNQTVNAGKPVPVAPAVKVTDADGRGVPGVAVSFTIKSGAGSVTGGETTTNSSGIATVGSWVLGLDGNSLLATSVGLTGSPLVFVATGMPFIQIVTFGDSNTDLGTRGTEPLIQATSYVSNSPSPPTPVRLGPNDPNNPFQLAGKIEARWRASRSEIIRAVNHGISGTGTGTGRNSLTSPNAFEVWQGVSRFEAEVLGIGYLWYGGELTSPTFPNGPVPRLRAFTPRAADFAYVSLGTNDVVAGMTPEATIANLARMADMWIAAGLPANHFIITTLPPREPQYSATLPTINAGIRGLRDTRGISLIDIAAFTSADDGLTWLRASLHVDNDSLHVAEEVRTWIAERVFEIINAP